MKLLLRKYRAFIRELFPPETSDSLERVAIAVLLVFVAAAPLLARVSPFALFASGEATGPAGEVSIELLAFSVAAITFFSRPRGERWSVPRLPLAAMVALSGVGCIQFIPLPERVLERAAPVSAQIYHEAEGVLALFGRKTVPSPRISVAPGATSGSVLLILACVALFLSAASLLRNRPRLRLFRAALLTSSAVQVLFAIGSESVRDRIHGLFFNSGHFAAYLEIALALAFGSVWGEFLTGSDRPEDLVGGAERFERRFVPLAGRVLLWSAIAVGIALTGSRAGLVAAVMTVLVLLAMGISRGRVKLSRGTIVGLISGFGVLLLGATIGSGPVLRSLGWDPPKVAISRRVPLWRGSLDAWREFPLLGSGLGTFREAFRRVQPRELPGLIEHAPADFLQLLVTGGVIGAALGIIGFVSLLMLLFRAWRKQRHRQERAFVLAGFGALLSLSLHGLADSNLSNPAVATTLACALGAAWAATGRKWSDPRQKLDGQREKGTDTDVQDATF